MNKTVRAIVFSILFSLVAGVFLFTTSKSFHADNVRIVVYSSICMIVLIVLFLEHFFSRPSDILAASVSVMLLILPVRPDLSRFGAVYDLFLLYTVIMAILALTSLVLLTDRESEESRRNNISRVLKNFCVRFGAGKIQFAILFFLCIFYYAERNTAEVYLLFGISFVALLIEPAKIRFTLRGRQSAESALGEIFGVQSRNVFLCRLFENINLPALLAPVSFIQSDGERIYLEQGIILDRYVLNQEQWVRILTAESLREPASPDSAARKRIVVPNQNAAVTSFFRNFVGIVIEDSTIEKIRFYYPSGALAVTDGRLLEVDSMGQKILYQIVQARTERMHLESRDQAAFIVGEAIQIGIWNQEKAIFDKFGWVPEINTPVFLAGPVESADLEQTEMDIGKIPGTEYPIILNKDTAITHHLAILGVTGSGKSVFARNLIQNHLADEAKVIAIDFTGEYAKKFGQTVDIISAERKTQLFADLEAIADELDKFANHRDKTLILAKEKAIQKVFSDSIKEYFESPAKDLAIFELPEVSNSTLIFDYTKWFFKVLFDIARVHQNYGRRVCVVLEEAHTVIPEWNFAGSSDKRAQGIVNSISQIALQGRKYNIGLMVIAQRTANVSKTILTQCNSIVAFQVFDNTTSEFLSNYIGTDMAKVLGHLKQQQAIAIGKCFRANVPLIFQVPHIEDSYTKKRRIAKKSP